MRENLKLAEIAPNLMIQIKAARNKEFRKNPFFTLCFFRFTEVGQET